MKRRILVSLACGVMLFFAGCGDKKSAPSEADFKAKLEKLVKSPGGHAVDPQKELDKYRAASDDEKRRMYNEVNK